MNEKDKLFKTIRIILIILSILLFTPLTLWLLFMLGSLI